MMKNFIKFALVSMFLISGCDNKAGTNPTPNDSASPKPVSGTVEFVKVKAVIDQRCVTCHSGASPSGGVSFSTDENIKAKADRIKIRAAEQKSMPPGNKTNITDDERALLGKWVEAGAPLK